MTEDRDEARATRQSFATSVLWAGPIGPEAKDGRALVDLTSFLVRDAHGVVDTLKETGQGDFALDAERSTVDLDACLAFPDNLEFEAILTYAGGGQIGDHVRSTSPTPDAITLVQHHSLIRLPDPGYQPREFDPRAGSFAITFHDYAAPLAALIERIQGAGNPVAVAGAFDKHELEAADRHAREERVTRGWRRLKELPGSGLPLAEYPLPEFRRG